MTVKEDHMELFLSDNDYRERRGYDGRRRGSGGGEEEEPVHPPERAGQQPAELQQHNWQSQDIQVGRARVRACSLMWFQI